MAHRYVLVSSSKPEPKALIPFPPQPCALVGTKDVLFCACRMPRMPVVSLSVVPCCDNTVLGLPAAPGDPSQCLVITPLLLTLLSLQYRSTHLGLSFSIHSFTKWVSGTASQCLLFIGRYSLIPEMMLSLMNSK